MADGSEQILAGPSSTPHEGNPPVDPAAPSLADPSPRAFSSYARVLGVFFFLYVFLVSVKAMGTGLKTYANDEINQARIHSLFSFASNPFVGLSAGILITAMVQSSSFTTSFIITLVATNQLTPAQAVPAIMGANIGTSVTNMLVSLAYWRRRREFRTTFSAAIVHDLFNLLVVLILLPLELLFGILSKMAAWSAYLFHLPEDMEMGKGFIKAITKPVIHWFSEFLSVGLGMSSNAVGLTLAIVGVVTLFIALIMLVKMLRGLMMGKLEALFRRFFFSNTFTALVVGIIVTVMVQSSSVTTSIIIPFVGAGLLTMRQIFPYLVGANIGTTCTGLIAAAAAHTNNALMIAFVHLLFNVLGASIFLPLRQIPINLARRISKAVGRNRSIAVMYIVGVFFVVPIVCIYLFSLVS